MTVTISLSHFLLDSWGESNLGTMLPKCTPFREHDQCSFGDCHLYLGNASEEAIDRAIVLMVGVVGVLFW